MRHENRWSGELTQVAAFHGCQDSELRIVSMVVFPTRSARSSHEAYQPRKTSLPYISKHGFSQRLLYAI